MKGEQSVSLFGGQPVFLDGDFSIYDAVIQTIDEDFEQASTELRLTSPSGEKVEYVGGTVGELSEGPKGRLITTNEEFLIFQSKKVLYAVRWEGINLLEYGQKASRRYVWAAVVSPLLLMSKSRKHYLTLGYTDEDGDQQAMVFRVDKSDIRTMLVCLEARANLRVEFQDEEARKAGKGN